MPQDYDTFIKLAIKNLSYYKDDFQALKKKLCVEKKLFPPTNADLRNHYNEMLKRGKIKRSEKLEKILKSRAVRTESGVAVIAVLTKPYSCPGKCLYCPTEKDMPKSYLSNEPAVMRAIKVNFDPYDQAQTRIKSLELNGHNTDKIELIVMGGTFSSLPKSYQKQFIYECFRACNEYGKRIKNHEFRIMNLDKLFLKEQERNEKAKHRIIGLTLETRPDYIDEKEIINFRNLGCTRVELGVQSIFNDVLEKNKRGHGVEETIRATKILKDAGFKINYHIMPGLYGSNLKKDYLMFRELFSNPDFQPDMLKIYPTVVTKNSALYKLWKMGKYKPLTDKQFEKFILKIKNNLIPPYVRIARLVRDVPKTSIVAGPTISNIRQLIKEKSNCQCIRCREVRADYRIDEKIILDRIDYNASDGTEIFLQYINVPLLSREGGARSKKLFALLRLRIPSYLCHPAETHNCTSLQNSAIIRELHTYGKLTRINKKDKNSPQHIGLGKKLVQEAEKIAKKEFKMDKMAVISGIGVRDYYRKLGYKLKDTYMVKNLKQ
ncbi:MAG: tRNA uridine(34) 5-carboxymethylaminomethyl modification radical SAM/GNAT enzyme Elp3 [bacterium]|nr:tRNA uridine(34) 5-carboxymethylaminomethyl modification radical SAM/GNAT enzyme Elp3 [bacterium]